jgi:ATP-binding cassette subfamily F protein 3
MKAVERKIAKLDDEKKLLTASLMTITDAKESKRVQDQINAMSAEIAELEHEWLQISGDLG